MEEPENKGFIYEFDGFVLDPNERTLTVDGDPLHLPAKEFDTLLYLLQHHGRALSKEELMSAIWRDSFVEESNLAKQISRLRKLLNTGGKELIKTIPKHGYRLTVSDLRVKEPDPMEPVILERRTVRRIKMAYPEAMADEPPSDLRRALLARPTTSRWMWQTGAVVFLAAIAVAVYFWADRRSEGPADLTRIRSVAVLPFRPASAGSTEEHVLLGLTDAVVTKLGSLKEIVVRPTSAVRRFATHDPVAAGRELSVDAVVEGSVQRDNGQMRVTIQLIGVDDGRLMWSGKFDERSTDMFALQDAISEQVALALQPGLSGDELTLLAKHYTTNPEAHYSYVRGRFSWNKRTANDLKEAIGHFNQAIAKDPNYALAYAGLADSYSLLADYAGALPGESYPLARDAALKALELDNSLAEAHTSLAYVNMYFYWDWQAAEGGYRRAIVLNPNYATAHQWYSEFLAAMGRFDEALTAIRRAKEIDPLSPVINAGEIWILYHARRYDEAIEQGKKLQDMRPEFAEVHEYLKRCYDQKGMYREAVASRQMRRKLAGVDPALTPAIKRAEAAKDQRSYWHSRLEQEIEDSKTEHPYPFEMAEIYSQLGDKDQAFEWLEKAFEARVYLMMYLKVLPNLDPLRSDPRFPDFLRRVGLDT
jgi:DNA-binding winged helix-turn-helix (wHTH) protein/TolB-like protein/Tfp pilus assembly protein PilF